MTYRVKQLVLDSQEVKVHGTFRADGEARMCLARVLEEAFDALELDAATSECRCRRRRPTTVRASTPPPTVKRTIYIHNCGVLFPLDDFPEVKRKALGADCSSLLGIDSASDLQARLSAPRPPKPKQQTFVPKAKSKRKPKKEKSFFDKFKAHRDRFFR